MRLLDGQVPGEQVVLGLQVPVRVVVRVHVEDPGEHLLRDQPDRILAEMLCLDDSVEELAAAAHFEAEVVHLRVLIDVVEAADVRMVQCLLKLDLALERLLVFHILLADSLAGSLLLRGVVNALADLGSTYHSKLGCLCGHLRFNGEGVFLSGYLSTYTCIFSNIKSL